MALGYYARLAGLTAQIQGTKKRFLPNRKELMASDWQL